MKDPVTSKSHVLWTYLPKFKYKEELHNMDNFEKVVRLENP